MSTLTSGQVVLGGQKKVPRTIEDLPQLFLKRFDLLYNRTNSAELVGKTGIFLGEDDTHTFASYLIRLRFINELTNPVYSNFAMNASYFRESQILPQLQQQCGQANVNGTKLRNMVIPLPPLAEQHRIVAKVNELMAICDRLDTQVTATQTESGRLLEAVLHEALEAASVRKSARVASDTV
jgi:type I restriction enzyme, S subunit